MFKLNSKLGLVCIILLRWHREANTEVLLIDMLVTTVTVI